MASLHEYYDPSRTVGSGNWLGVGQHDVRVVSFDTGNSLKKNTPYVRFEMEDRDGGTARRDFYLTPNAMFLLASFAKACGLSEQHLMGYDPELSNAHARLQNKWVRIKIEKDGKYHEIVAWEPCSGASPMVPTPESMPTAAEANAVPHDDIPF